MVCMVAPFPLLALQQWQDIYWKQSQSLWNANVAAMETIWHRSVMMGQVAGGQRSANDPEFSRMLSEKIKAGMEGQMAMMQTLQRFGISAFFNPSSLPKTGKSALRKSLSLAEDMMEAGTAKGYSTVRRNAKRLRNKK
jgi:hypothetical protein